MEIVGAECDGRLVRHEEADEEHMLIRMLIQIYPWLNGWKYKNTASNGGLFHLGARLAMYTKNDTYAVWAEKAYDWMAASPLLQPPDGTVNDGTSLETIPMCKDADHTQWTYNYGILIAGTAYVCEWSIKAETIVLMFADV
jgi:predicted alpha-1,6-mannanase (GH76 family)